MSSLYIFSAFNELFSLSSISYQMTLILLALSTFSSISGSSSNIFIKSLFLTFFSLSLILIFYLYIWARKFEEWVIPGIAPVFGISIKIGWEIIIFSKIYYWDGERNRNKNVTFCNIVNFTICDEIWSDFSAVKW